MVTKENETKLEYMNKKIKSEIKIGEVISLDSNSDFELKDISFIESDGNYYLVPFDTPTSKEMGFLSD